MNYNGYRKSGAKDLLKKVCRRIWLFWAQRKLRKRY